MQRLGLVIKQLQELLPLAGVGSDIGKDVLKMLNIAVKHVPSGSSSPAAEKNNIENMAMRNAQQGMASRQMAEQRAQQMKGGGAQQMAAAA
jgi:hypothetical protein